MSDVFSKNKRSWIMGRVRGKDTSIEKKIRLALHRLGYRYHLHRKDLPGNPDIFFPSRKKVIFVHGCFWHGHDCPRGGRVPKENTEYWQNKIKNNIERDKKNQEALKSLGLKILIVWECDLKDSEKAILNITKYLSAD